MVIVILLRGVRAKPDALRDRRPQCAWCGRLKLNEGTGKDAPTRYTDANMAFSSGPG